MKTRLLLATTFALLPFGLVPFESAADEKPTDGAPAPLQFEDPFFADPVEPLKPKATERSEKQQDRLESAALYSHGRMLFQRQKHGEALQKFQRAYRRNPAMTSILREIVPLAFSLQRNQQAARYAVIAAEKDPRDPVLLRRLANHLTQMREWPRALKLIEKSLELQLDRPRDVGLVMTRLDMGRLYFLTEDFKRSAEAFEQVVDALANPETYNLNENTRKLVLGKPERTYLLFAESFLKAEKYDAAEKMFNKANAEKPDAATFAYHQARVAFGRENYDEVLKKLEVYFDDKLDTSAGGPYDLLERTLAKTEKDAKQAEAKLLEKLGKLYKDDATNPALAYFYGNALRDAGKLDEAAKVYDAALTQDVALSGFQGLVEIYKKQNKPEDLIKTLAFSIREASSLEALGDETNEMLKDKKLAKQLIDTGRKLHQQNKLPAGGAWAISEVALANEFANEANEFYELAKKDTEPPTAEVMISHGLALLRADDAAGAAAVFKEAIEENVQKENNAAFNFYLATSAQMADDTKTALKAARAAAELDPDNARFATRVGWVHYYNKHYKKALAEYELVFEEFDDKYDSPETREVMREARMVLSNINVELGNLPAAEEWLEEVLDEFPEDIGAMNDLGYLWIDQNKRLNRGMEMVKKAIAQEPENMAYLDSLGWGYYRLGQFDKAVETMLKAVEAADGDPDGVILYHLADAYLGNGQKDEGLKTLKMALKAFDEKEDAKYVAEVKQKIADLESK